MISRDKKTFNGIMAFALVVVLVFMIKPIKEFIYFRDIGITHGIIVKHTEWQPKAGHLVEYRYKIEGVTYNGKYSSNIPLSCFIFAHNCKGDTIKVVYSLKNHSKSRIIIDE